jgi:putative colanic acid biosynthesis acetyltransferase WcaF
MGSVSTQDARSARREAPPVRAAATIGGAPSATPVALVRHDLRAFTGSGYDRGRNAAWQIAWQLASGLIVMRWWCPPAVRASILRMFGATIGTGVVIRHRVRIHWPWKLSIGDGSWIGEGAWLLNLEPITIGNDVCISQEVLLCTGSHDRRSPTFEYDNAPIEVDDGAWIAARATVLRGSRIGADSVIGATALITGDVAAGETVLAARAARHPAT